MAAKARMANPANPGDGIIVRPLEYDRTRESVTLLARAVGYYDFSDPDSRVFRARSPRDDYRETTSRNRVTLPDFTDLGDGAWKLLRWFRSRPAGDPIAAAFYNLLSQAVGVDGDGDQLATKLFDPRLESYEVARIIAECALGVLVPAEKRGWV